MLDDNTDWLILQKTFDEGEGGLLWRVMYMQGYGRYWHGDMLGYFLQNGLLRIRFVDFPLKNPSTGRYSAWEMSWKVMRHFFRRTADGTYSIQTGVTMSLSVIW